MATQTSNGQNVRTVNIKGKLYVDVAERVRLAHDAGGYSMTGNEVFTIGDTGRWWVRITIEVGEQHYSGTSEIKFSAKAGTADGEAPVECAETSALGRALGFAGLGMLDSIASADEMSRSSATTQPAQQQQRQQQAAQPTTASQPAHAAPTMASLFERSKALGMSMPEWNTLQKSCKGEVDAISHALNSRARQAR